MRIVNGGVVSNLLRAVGIPKMFPARQCFPRPLIVPAAIPDAVRAALARERPDDLIRPGMKVAITAGSRGIANVGVMTRAIADFVKARGAQPFIVAAMGSHGGATAAGQAEILAGFGITEASMGCPVRSSMETVLLGYSVLGAPVFCDKNAYEADGIIVSCRIKPHNAFRGRYESGPCKMMTVGLGKQKGAEAVHSAGMGVIARHIEASARIFLEKAPVMLALVCIENAYDETCKIEAIAKADILTREPELLTWAFSHMPRLLVGEGDVLIVDEIGKHYSGTGVDPNITGTFSTEYASGGVRVQRTCMLDLAAASQGNGLGTGLASAITRRLFDKLDTEKMYANSITSTVLKSAGIPLVLNSDREAIQLCIRTLNGADPARLRLIRIANSLHIERIMLSEAYYQDTAAGRYEGLEALGGPDDMRFDAAGNLLTPIGG